MNYFAYRLPGNEEIVAARSSRLLHGNEENMRGVDTFHICTFSGVKRIIPADEIISLSELDTISLPEIESADCKEQSTSPLQHQQGVKGIVRAIHAGKLSKCVLARKIVIAGKINLKESFLRLCRSYPNAFVFFYYTPEFGAWLGATPETLMDFNGERIRTMALAGTKAADNQSAWDSKNREEHQIVVRFIAGQLLDNGYIPEVGETTTRTAGPVQHLMTPIEANCKDTEHALRLATMLSPTPALCGAPRKEAQEMIARLEGFDRECYGGYCGPMDESGAFQFFVNIRNMKIFQNYFCIFAGGGIMEDSDPESEWEETECKASTLAEKIIRKRTNL